MNLRDYLRTSEAAEFLGVSPGTVRNWERQGKLHARRLPQNGYRLFRRTDLEAVLADLEDPEPKQKPKAQQTPPRNHGETA